MTGPGGGGTKLSSSSSSSSLPGNGAKPGRGRGEAGKGTGTLEHGAESDGTAFSRSIETIQGLPSFSNLNVLGPGSNTLNGPSYGRQRGGRTASTRTKTKAAECKAEGIRGEADDAE